MKYLFLAVSLSLAVATFAQGNGEDKKDKKEKKVKPPKADEKFFYKEATLETDDYKIYITDAVAVGAYSKFKMKVFNKTNDFILIKPSEFIFKAGDKTVTNMEKNFFVAPNDQDSKVIDFKGTIMQSDKYTIEANGVYKVSAGGISTNAANFDLPPSKNDFTAGNFNCILKKYDANTDKATAKFECSYNGDGIGVIFPYKAACIMPNAAENANSKKSGGIILEKGKSNDFTLVFNEIVGAGDLQKKAIKVKWNDTFKESKLAKLNDAKIEMEKDPMKVK